MAEPSPRRSAYFGCTRQFCPPVVINVAFAWITWQVPSTTLKPIAPTTVSPSLRRSIIATLLMNLTPSLFARRYSGFIMSMSAAAMLEGRYGSHLRDMILPSADRHIPPPQESNRSKFGTFSSV